MAARKISWWWWFRFGFSSLAIASYNYTAHPHGFAGVLGCIGVGIVALFALDGCRADYRHEQRKREEQRERKEASDASVRGKL